MSRALEGLRAAIARGRPTPDPATAAVEDRMCTALGVLRVLLLINALGLNLLRFDGFAHPYAGFAAMALMIGWTGVALIMERHESRRTPSFLVVDLALAAGLILASPLIKGPGMLATIPGFWVMGAVMAWAVHWGAVGGLMAAVLVTSTDLAVRTQITQANYGNVFLLLVGGAVVGHMCGSLKRLASERDQALQLAAAATERNRLARVVHDGVLQVLALVQRRGSEWGGEAAELGRLAARQEESLRTLIREQDAVAVPAGGGGAVRTAETADLCRLLVALETRPDVRASVATPPGMLRVEAARAEEIVAVVRASVDNVARHVGEGVPVWILLEDDGEHVEISVRDEGPGIAPGRLEQAREDGRLGVSQSIQGRVRDLDGRAELSTGGFGTEWEFRIPVRSDGAQAQ